MPVVIPCPLQSPAVRFASSFPKWKCLQYTFFSVPDVIDRSTRMLFANRIAWLSRQRECPDVRRVDGHLSQDAGPSKRDVRVQNVKRYLQRVTTASDDLLIVMNNDPFHSSKECIVVSRAVLHGLATAFHLRFHHPHHTRRNSYTFDTEGVVKTTCSSRDHCNSHKYIPIAPQSSCNPLP